MTISKILDFSAGSKFTLKLPLDIRYDPESQNCDWVLFSVTPLWNLADSLTMARGTYAVHVRFGLERLLDSSICKWYLYPNNSIIFTLLNNTIVPTFIYFLSVNPWTGLIMECSIAYGLLDKNRFSIWNWNWTKHPTKPHYATGPSSLDWNPKNKYASRTLCLNRAVLTQRYI